MRPESSRKGYIIELEIGLLEIVSPLIGRINFSNFREIVSRSINELSISLQQMLYINRVKNV